MTDHNQPESRRLFRRGSKSKSTLNQASELDSETISRDERLISAIEQYRAAIDAGQPLAPHVLLDQYPDLAEELAGCLAGIHLLTQVAANVQQDVEHASSQESRLAADSGASREAVLPERQVLGDFRIRREIGRGGMGVVYEAEQLSLGRTVALKVLPYAAMFDHRQLQRFQNEARAAAALDHSNIVPIYYVGSDRGVHFFAMQLIHGKSLAEVISVLCAESKGEELATPATPSNVQISPASDTRPLALLTTFAERKRRSFFDAVARIGYQAAAALHYAHERGIVHRDIKPANLLLDDTTKVYISDFGLARIGSEPGLTMTGDLVGTLRYMSPEQAFAKHVDVDHRSDVYSLGMTLYELLTRQPAFAGRDREELLRQIAFDEPTPIRRIVAEVPAELETIVMKAISKEREARYETAQHLADDLQRFLHGQPIRARRISYFGRLRKWTRRNAAAVSSSLAVLCCALLVLAVVFVRSHRTEHALRLKAETQANRARKASELARAAVDDMYLEIALDWLPGDRALTEKQARFLEQARSYYEYMANQVESDDPDSLYAAAAALQRVAKIQYRQQQLPAALSSVTQSIESWRHLISLEPDEVDYQQSLKEDLDNRGIILQTLGQYDAALRSYEDCQKLANTLFNDSPEDAEAAYQLTWNSLNLTRINTLLGNLAASEHHLQQADVHLKQLFRTGPGTSARDLRIKVHTARAELLLARGRIVEAEQLAREQLRWCQSVANDEPDDLELHRNHQALLHTLARICHQADKLPEAVDLLQQSLQLQQAAMVDQASPTEVLARWFFAEDVVITEYVQPEAYVTYAETQLYLSSLLRMIGRPHAAERELAEAWRTARFLVLSYGDNPRYQVALANALSELAVLQQSTRPESGPDAVRLAANGWANLQATFPESIAYRSGLHGMQPDLGWFHAQFPDRTIETVDRRTESELQKTVTEAIESRFLGISLLRCGLNSLAIQELEGALQADLPVPAYDHLYLALAHHRAGAVDKAKDHQQQARQWLRQHKPRDQELRELWIAVNEELP